MSEEYEPTPIADMDKKRWEGHHTICQFLRDIYHMTNNEEIRLKCRLGMAQTKVLHDKLKEYAARRAEFDNQIKEEEDAVQET